MNRRGFFATLLGALTVPFLPTVRATARETWQPDVWYAHYDAPRQALVFHRDAFHLVMRELPPARRALRKTHGNRRRRH